MSLFEQIPRGHYTIPPFLGELVKAMCEYAEKDSYEYLAKLKKRLDVLSWASQKATIEGEIKRLIQDVDLKIYRSNTWSEAHLFGFVSLGLGGHDDDILNHWQEANGDVKAFVKDKYPLVQAALKGLAIDQNLKGLEYWLATGKTSLPPFMPRLERGEPSNFEDLFTSSKAMERALYVALKVGLVDANGCWLLGERSKKGLVQFWKAISDHRYGLTHLFNEPVLPCQVIAKRFGTTISKTAVYNHLDDKTGSYLQKCLNVLSGIYRE